jgi:hypothetical protein
VTTHGYKNHAVRSESWRLIRYEKGGEELYDETADPYEWTNLAEAPEHASIKAELAKSLPDTDHPDNVSKGVKLRKMRKQIQAGGSNKPKKSE